MLTMQELAHANATARRQGLPAFVLCARRVRDGKQLPAPKNIRGLRVNVIGGNSMNYFVTVECGEAERFLLGRGRGPERGFTLDRLRVQDPSEKLSAALREQMGIPHPPIDPWTTTPAGPEA